MRARGTEENRDLGPKAGKHKFDQVHVVEEVLETEAATGARAGQAEQEATRVE